MSVDHSRCWEIDMTYEEVVYESVLKRSVLSNQAYFAKGRGESPTPFYDAMAERQRTQSVAQSFQPFRGTIKDVE